MTHGLEVYNADGSVQFNSDELLTRLIYTRFLSYVNDPNGSVTIPGLSAMEVAAFTVKLSFFPHHVTHQASITLDTVFWSVDSGLGGVPSCDSQLIVVAYG